MKYYIREVQMNQGVQMTAGIKARDDVEEILQKEGFLPITISSNQEGTVKKRICDKIKMHKIVLQEWDKKTSCLHEGDTVVIQFPIIEHSIYLSKLIRKLDKNGINVILVIHDLELLRVAKRKDTPLKKKIRVRLEEKNTLLYCTKIISHNKKMSNYLAEIGIAKNKIVNLEIFDYLIPEYESKRKQIDTPQCWLSEPVIIAGTLRPHKAQYVYHLPDTVRFRLYGVGYEGKTTGNIEYQGAFPPENLPFELKGSFGLVWDGEQAETCSGIYGEYLKINNPHKTSLYLASGLPILIWEKAALSNFIVENQCGITIKSLHEIPATLEKITEEEYSKLLKNAERVGQKMRDGYYIKKALDEAKKMR